MKLVAQTDYMIAVSLPQRSFHFVALLLAAMGVAIHVAGLTAATLGPPLAIAIGCACLMAAVGIVGCGRRDEIVLDARAETFRARTRQFWRTTTVTAPLSTVSAARIETNDYQETGFHRLRFDAPDGITEIWGRHIEPGPHVETVLGALRAWLEAYHER